MLEINTFLELNLRICSYNHCLRVVLFGPCLGDSFCVHSHNTVVSLRNFDYIPAFQLFSVSSLLKECCHYQWLLCRII